MSNKKLSLLAIAVFIGVQISGCKNNNENSLHSKADILDNNSKEQKQDDSRIIKEKRSDYSTDIENFKLLGFGLGETYSGSLGYDWSEAAAKRSASFSNEKSLFDAEIKFLRPDLFKGSVFLRMEAPRNLGEMAILISPKSKKILNVVLVKYVEKYDISSFSDYIAEISNECPNYDYQKLIEVIKEKKEFSIPSKEVEGSVGCSVTAVGWYYENEYAAQINIGRGKSKLFRDGKYKNQQEYYKPANMQLKLDSNILMVSFTNSEMSLYTYDNDTALLAKIGKNPKDLINEDILGLVNDGDMGAIILAAKSARDPKESLSLLQKIENSSVDAKVLAGKIYLENVGALGSYNMVGKLGITDAESYKEAFVRLKAASEDGSKEGKILLSRMYEGFGVEKNLSIAAKLLSESENQGALFNFCMRHDTVSECSSIVKKVQKDREDRIAREMADIGKYSITASCSGPARDYIRTIMSFGDNATGLVSAVNSANKFCSMVNQQLSNIDILLNKELVSTGQNGSKFYIAKTSDPNIMVGLTRRPD